MRQLTFLVAALLTLVLGANAHAQPAPTGQPQRPAAQAPAQSGQAQPARPAARAPERGRMFEDWGIECESQADRRELCFAQQTHTQRETNQRIVSISVGYIGANNAPMVVVFTPLGVNVAAGAALRIDTQPQIPMSIQTCIPEGCRATAALTPEQLRAFASARTITLGIIPWGSDQTSTAAISIRGLSAALAHLRSAQ